MACPEGPPPWPTPDEDVREALQAAYLCGDWGRYHGRYCEQLAADLATYHNAPLVTLCCSGTFAVELALRGLGIAPGDEVLLAGYDFPGNFRAIEDVGGVPVLVDLAEGNWNLDPALLDAAAGPAVRAIVVSHLHGGVVPMRGLTNWARDRGIAVVEDACQAPGATIEGRPAGTWGDVGVLSFGGSKLLTAGRGGALLTRREDAHQRMKVFCERGNQAFPLSELQAAVLIPQLRKLNERHALRQSAAARLLAALDGCLGLRPLVNTATETSPGYYKLGLKFVPQELPGVSRDDFSAYARAEGIALDAGFRGFLHRGSRRCRRAGDLSHSTAAAGRMLVLHHPVLLAGDGAVDRLVAGLKKIAAALASR